MNVFRRFLMIKSVSWSGFKRVMLKNWIRRVLLLLSLKVGNNY